MKLKTVLSGIDYTLLQDKEEWENYEVSGISADSRKAEMGDVFVCIKGTENDGHAFIWDVYQKNVDYFVVDKRVMNGSFIEFPRKACIIQVENTREAYAVMAANFWHHPEHELRLIGITGTKGKTTVASIIRSLLESQGRKAGYIGTLGIYDGEVWISEKNTTPDAFTIHKYFDKMKGKGCEFAVMEVSSQGIKQQRIHGLWFEIAVFTNLGVDHIGPGEHKSLEEYRYYKSQLFSRCGIGICNLDDLASSCMFHRKKCQKFGYSCQRELCSLGQVDAGRVLLAEQTSHMWEDGKPFTSFTIQGETYLLQMPGLFNVYNALAALQVMQCFSFDISRCKDALRDAFVNGRMERIAGENNIACYVDYAHNGMSLKEALSALREFSPERIILVFGCGGNKTLARREEMGKAAGKYADYVIVTNDNPRFEDPQKIADEIVTFLGKEKDSYEIILDRKEAVLRAIEMAEEQDIVLIAGKGHETSQEVNGICYDMDDHALVRDALQKRMNT